MNKEEIEKVKQYFKDEISSNFNYLDISGEDYAEFKNNETILLEYIKELEQKESILDKVTKFANKIATENAEKYNSENQKEVDFSEWNLALEILNIIEGEKKQ